MESKLIFCFTCIPNSLWPVKLCSSVILLLHYVLNTIFKCAISWYLVSWTFYLPLIAYFTSFLYYHSLCTLMPGLLLQTTIYFIYVIEFGWILLFWIIYLFHISRYIVIFSIKKGKLQQTQEEAITRLNVEWGIVEVVSSQKYTLFKWKNH